MNKKTPSTLKTVNGLYSPLKDKNLLSSSALHIKVLAENRIVNLGFNTINRNVIYSVLSNFSLNSYNNDITGKILSDKYVNCKGKDCRFLPVT